MAMQVEQEMAAGSASSQLGGGEGEAQEPSAEDLKAQLFRSLQAKGILSQLKSQLRCRLVQELRGSTGSSATPPIPLALRVANSIVAEHLRGCGYQYSLSTFLPESDTDIDRLLSREDILHYLHLQPPAPLHSALTTDSGTGFLRDLLESLSTVSVGGATCDHTHSIGIQTEERGRVGVVTLAERLRALDEHHMAQLAEEGEGEKGKRREEWKREYEEKLRKEMEREMERFRESEVVRVRQEERQSCEAELRNLRIEQEETHRKKMESLRRLELDTLNSLRSRQLEAEAALFSRRQELELQLQAVGVREEQLKRETEAKQQALLLVEQRLSAAAEQLRVREREVVGYRQQMESVVRGELASWEAQFKAEQGHQNSVKAEVEQARVAVKEERRRREEVEEVLHEASRQVVELQRQREDSLRALEKVSDYGSLKQQLAEVRSQLAKTERRLSETRGEHRRLQTEQQEMIRGLRRQLARPGGEQGREEVERMKRELQIKLTEAEEEKKHLRQEVVRQTAVVGRQRTQLEEQALGLREMEREVRDLTSQLAHWQTSILHTRYTRSVKPRGAHPSHHLPTPSPPHLPLPPSPQTSPPNLVQETRATFLQLEQEAAELERHYHLFQPDPPSLSLHTLTSSPSHTPTSGTPVSHPVGRACSVTTSSSAPFTLLTTFTKTTPTYQLPMTTPTSQPTKTTPTYQLPMTTPTSQPTKTTPTYRLPMTTPTSLPNLPPKATRTPLPNLPPTTTPTSLPTTATHTFVPKADGQSRTAPTAGYPLPKATPTSELAVPHLSLDQLWRQSSQQPTSQHITRDTSLPTATSSLLVQPTPDLSPSSAAATMAVSSAQLVVQPTPDLSPSSAAAAATTYTSSVAVSAAQPTTSPSEVFSSPLPTSLAPTISSLPPPAHLSTSVAVASTGDHVLPPTSTDTLRSEKATSSRGNGGEEEVDPLMMKYMELVSQKRARERREEQDFSLSDHNLVNEVRSLSQATDSGGGFSDGDQSRDPFQDW